MPSPKFAPMARPKLLLLLLGTRPNEPTFEYLMPGETYGSMLRPGVGTLMLRPIAPVTVVRSGAPVAVARAAPPCRFTDNGSRLPPMTRNATSPPTDV